MNVEFRKSFETDLSKIRDAELLKRIQAVIEEVESVNNWTDLINQYYGQFFERFCKAFRACGSRIELFYQS